ncbi:uncharacterized protein LOC144453513 [Glandiceps talaboti]
MAKMEDQEQCCDQEADTGIQDVDTKNSGLENIVTTNEQEDSSEVETTVIYQGKKCKKEKKKKKKKKVEKDEEKDKDESVDGLQESNNMKQVRFANGYENGLDSELTAVSVHHKKKKSKKDKKKGKELKAIDFEKNATPELDAVQESNKVMQETLVNGHEHDIDSEKSVVQHVHNDMDDTEKKLEKEENKGGDKMADIIEEPQKEMTVEVSESSDVEESEKESCSIANKQEEKKTYDSQQYFAERRKSSAQIEKFEREVIKMQCESQDITLSNEERLEKLWHAADELTQLEEELNRRFKQCQDYKEEITEAEKYFDRRHEIINHKEADLVELDDELDKLHRELEIDKSQLNHVGVKVDEVIPSTHRNRFVAFTSQDEDYILKVNIRKLQGDLKACEQTIALKDEDMTHIQQELTGVELDRRKKEQRIKHLESQLQIALGQLNHRQSMTDITGNGSVTSDRARSGRRHVSLDRMNSNELSINQIAQMNRARRATVPGSTDDISSKLTEMTAVKSARNSETGTEVGEVKPASSKKRQVSTTCVIL